MAARRSGLVIRESVVGAISDLIVHFELQEFYNGPRAIETPPTHHSVTLKPQTALHWLRRPAAPGRKRTAGEKPGVR
jgi:hypothetical protein